MGYLLGSYRFVRRLVFALPLAAGCAPPPVAQLTGRYVNNFRDVLGDADAETELLTYAECAGIDYLLVYSTSFIHQNSYDSTAGGAQARADYVTRARMAVSRCALVVPGCR